MSHKLSKSRVAGISGGLLLTALVLHLLPAGWTTSARDVVLVLASLVAGIPIAISALQSLRHKAFSIDLLVTIAVTGALVIGEFVESAVVSFLFVFGSWLEARTLARTRNSLRELIDLAPTEAEVRRGDEVLTVDIDDVEPGDVVILRTGSRVPVDGRATTGTALLDEAAITGEPLPVAKDPGDEIWSGTVVADGYLEITAERVGEDTTFARIIELVEEAQDSKARTQRFLDRFAAWYTPAVIVASVLALVITRDIRFALTFLVIACPGALVISTPVSLVAGLGNAARHGVLIKGGDALERLARFNTLALDKTGTLTRGKPQLSTVVALPGHDEDDVLRLAASLEQASEHPLGRTIVTAATDNGLGLSAPPAGVEVSKGAGIQGLVADGTHTRAVAVGNERMLASLGLDASTLHGNATTLEKQGNTVSFVVVDGGLAGLVAISDAVRPEAAPAIAALRRRGVDEIVMLTGDNPHTARAVAEQAGITGADDQVHASLLPEDKVTHVQDLTSRRRLVAMVGDGVNDAPALATADIGIAMGGGTDVALETADVVLVGSRFDQLLHARSVSRATMRNMRQNTVIALGTVALLLLGVMGGVVGMSGGMLVHEASVLAVILNAMRLIRFTDRDASQLSPDNPSNASTSAMVTTPRDSKITPASTSRRN